MMHRGSETRRSRQGADRGRGMHFFQFFDHKIETIFVCDQNLLLKFTAPSPRASSSERATGALATVNHHSNRCRALLAAFGGDRVGGIMVDYFPERMITESSYFNQLCRRAHIETGPPSSGAPND